MNAGLQAEVLGTHTPELFQAAVRRAVELLRDGAAVALPTETVYGLAANALDPKAVSEIYRIKGRPAHNPIIVHVASAEMARTCVADWPDLAEKLARSFWPGPLTVVLARAKRVPDIVTAGGPTVGVRWPSHPFIQAVIRECGFPLAAPSANLSNRISPTTALHVRSQLGDKVRLIVDGGPSQVGIESTVLDLTTTPAHVLRPGMIHAAALEAVIGRVSGAGFSVSGVTCQVSGAKRLRSPGLLQKHYAPRAKLVVWDWRDEAELRRKISNLKSQISNCAVIAHSRIPSPHGFGQVSVVPHDPAAFARALYGELHRCDEAGAGLIVVESPPDLPEWMAVADRLRKAAAG
jgi:L-threonylcarbamoyladenylate synthase